MAVAPSILALELGPWDAGIVLAYLVATTWIGGRLAGRQRTLRDFFLGGRKLPWYAVAGSIVATEISAVTFVGLPYVVFRPGGDLTYLQLGLFGSLLARLAVGFFFVPAYYRHEIYSPYDYMGRRLGEPVRRAATALFMAGGVLAQSARVFLTAVVLELVLWRPVFGPLERATGIDGTAWAVFAIVIVAVAWTLLGGIATVVWTDVALFFVFVTGAFAALAVVLARLDLPLADLLVQAHEAGKLRFLDLSTDPTRPYTLPAALFGASIGMAAAYGTDQLMAQRALCCRGPREARRAVIASIVGQAVTVLVSLVGIGLWAFYRDHPLTGERLALFREHPDRIFPIFVLDHVPVGLTGLVVAGVLAAAISSLDSILAALAQTTVSTWVEPALRARGGASSDRRLVAAGRAAVAGWGIALGAAALFCGALRRHYPSLLDLALAMAGYTGGALLAGFLLALEGDRRLARGFLFSAPLSVLAVFSAVWSGPVSDTVLAAGGAVLAALLWRDARRSGPVGSLLRRFAALAIGLALLAGLRLLRFPDPAGGAAQPISWPWYVPLGLAVAWVFARLLAPRTASETARPAGAGDRGGNVRPGQREARAR